MRSARHTRAGNIRGPRGSAGLGAYSYTLESFGGSGGGGIDRAVAGAGREIFRLNREKSAPLLTIG
jgi:hypothetical protein